MDRGRGDRHAARFPGVKRTGADGAGAATIFRTCLCVSWPTRRYGEGSLVRWGRIMFVSEKAGARTLCMAAGAMHISNPLI